MAKIKYSALVSEMRNKLNGSVLSKNRYGNYIRNKVTPVNPQTSFQLNQRSILSALSAGWRGLTQNQRDEWSEAAKQQPTTDIFGDTKILSGQAFYVSRNLNLVGNSQAQISSPGVPVDVPFVDITSSTVQVDLGEISIVQLAISASTIPAGFVAVVYATPSYSPGRSFVKNQFRRLGVFTASGGAIDVSLAYIAKFGSAAIGEKVSFRLALVATSTGQMGLPTQSNAIVEAA